MQEGAYGQSYVFPASLSESEIKEMVFAFSEREVGKLIEQGATSILDFRVFIGEICDMPTYDPNGGFPKDEYDEDQFYGCDPNPHRHCGWKCKVAV